MAHKLWLAQNCKIKYAHLQMNYPPRLQATLDLLNLIKDRDERIQALISIADRFRPVGPTIAEKPYPESHRVPGCESEAFVWAIPQFNEATSKFYYAVENPQGIAAKALCVILDEDLSLQPIEYILSVPDDVIYDIFGRELSMGKSMGLQGLVQMTKALAKANFENQPS